MAQPTRTLRRVVGLAWSCRRSDPAVSQRTPRHVAAHARPYRTLCLANHVVAPPRGLLRVSQLPARYSGASLGRVAPMSLYNLAAKPPSYHNTIYCIATHSPSSQALTCALLALARGPAVSQPNWPYRGPGWLYHGVPVCAPTRPLCQGTPRPCLS